jgi:MinD superfamily P-loop ATPase
MKEIVVISGKGGTGKTSITASFAYLGGKDIVVADCDVDAADLFLLLKPDFQQGEDFYSGMLAKINSNKCTLCGTCATICRFDAISFIKNRYIVDTFNCEGCGYCSRICPSEAITMEDRHVGKWFISTTKFNSSMVHARLGAGAENSGKLVAKVKREARIIAEKANLDIVLVDGAPGIGCPVVSSLSGASVVVLVTEPTQSGLHDLKRVIQLVKKFKINAGCIINKFDLNLQITAEIEDFLKKEDIVFISRLPYDETFTKAMINGQTILEYDFNNLKEVLIGSWDKVKQIKKAEGA